MKKTFKRIIALAIVLCTVGAMMIPGVSAAANDVTVNFAAATGGYYIRYGAETDILKALDTGFGTDNIWKFYRTADGKVANNCYAGSSNLSLSAGNGFQLYNQSTDGSYKYIAIEFQAPAVKGTYTLDLSWSFKSNMKDAGAYIIEIPAENYANLAAMPKQDSDKALALNTIDLSVVGGNATKHSFAGTNTVDLDPNGRYAVVFFVQNTGATSYIYLNSFTLRNVPTYDYSVIYNANYGAEPTVKVDTVTTTAAEAEMTVKENTFVREGYEFKGWATADGEVVYQAGDTIKLTSAAPVQNLYAIWEEAWNPANNKDMSINFKDVSTKAGVTANTYWSAGYPGKTDAVYAETGWTATLIYNTYPPRYYATGGIQFYPNAANTTKYAASKFIAPGTGDYRLSLTPCVISSADPRADIGGAYVIPYGNYTASNLPAYTTVDNAVILDSTQLKSGKAVSAEKTVALNGGEEYLLVFFVKSDVATDKADFSGFSLTEVKPAATIGTKTYETLAGALAGAVSGDTIKLNMNVTAGEVDLTEKNLILDLNGKTLTTAEAVVGTVMDSKDGAGFIDVAVQADATITAVDGQIALWDNNQEGYRVFTYDFKTYEAVAGNDNVTAVDQKIHFYDYVTDNDIDIGTADKGIKLTTDTTLLADVKDAYEAGTINWRVEMTQNLGQFAAGKGNGFSSGDASVGFTTYTGWWNAIRFRAPKDASGNMTLALKTGAGATSVMDVYIIKASVIEDAAENYAENAEAFSKNPTDSTAAAPIQKAIANAIAGATPVFTGVAANQVNTLTYKFEASAEYILVMKATNSDTTKIRLEDLNITRAAKQGEAQTFWSDIEFTNDAAYQYLPNAGLQVGFKMSTLENPSIENDNDWKPFRLEDATVAAWADAESINKDGKNWGFYIRVSGFEKLTEETTVTCVPYISINNETITADPVTYNYMVAE